jgi:DNA-binding NarL/FixJ family response regulator
VLRFIAGGVRSSDIADRLQISAQAVGTHRRDIMRKLGLRTIAELTRYAVREGLVEP